MIQPSASIITICRNASSTIERALRSVIACGYQDIEYVVVDGASSDGTLAVIERYRDHIDQFVSEPDSGISDALNKGVRMSRGRYHIVVHADDELIPGALAGLAGHALATGASVASGRVLVMRAGKLSREFVPDPDRLTEKMSIPHMSSLIERDAWEAAGGYDPRRRIAMDHLLMLRILNRRGRGAFATIEAPIARHYLGGLSSRHMVEGFREVRENLLEAGIGRMAANIAYAKLLAKSRLASAIGR